jgi:hypothetical protein
MGVAIGTARATAKQIPGRCAAEDDDVGKWRCTAEDDDFM